jgi:glutathione S-transferase
MTVLLYSLAGSGSAWRVQLALEHKGIAHEVKTLDGGREEHRSEAYLAMNPRGKVPVIRDGDFTLYESTAILEYLEEKYTETKNIYPKDVAARARVRRLVCEIDNHWLPVAIPLSQNLFFKSEEQDCDEQEIAVGIAGVLSELEFFEREIRGDSFTGDLGAADFVLYPYLAYLARYELRRASLGLTAAIGPGLRKLMALVESQPYFDRTYPQHWR